MLKKIYVVSLVDSNRRENIKKMADSLGLCVFFEDAIYGKNLQKSYIDNINTTEWVVRKYKRKIGPSEIGCSLSHRNIYSKIGKENNFYIILEDDVFFDYRLKELAKIDTSLLNKKSLYLLGGQDGLSSKDMIITSKYDVFSLSNDIIFKRVIFSDKYVYRTCCYMIHSELAKELFVFSKKNFYLADDWLNLSKNKVFNKIYISDIISHPIDLVDSKIENERKPIGEGIFYSLMKKNIMGLYKKSRCLISKIF
ncbi:glycosyltransferase family 25 protein [Photobacterium kishitanii]|uniref:glycosyltransferase family 25 protein n=1 Tax=Photobacterium kishitanii TaxID=318456 RepID=UPI000D16EAA3|nr:glycosyltransferase family 25 protein [Photobacterium kishitanii]PSV18341.1 glycosyl transferase [Photobacterium kishitanii]